MEFVDDWFITATLGEGAFGEVKLLHHKTSNEFVALKILQFSSKSDTPTNTPTNTHTTQKKLEKAEAEQLIKKEIQIHKQLKHENIIKFFGARMDSEIWYIFLEYADGGELYDRIEPDVGLTPPSKTPIYLSQIISALIYLHSKGIAHRDLKPENILLSNDMIKISDFGFATLYRNEKGVERLLEQKCGTPPYLAPEVWSGRSYRAMGVDVWSVGIILVAMIAGELPWDRAEVISPEYKSWKESTPLIKPPWNKFDLATLNFLKRLLAPLPSKRINLEQIQNHPWLLRRSNKRKSSASPDPHESMARKRACSSSTSDLVSKFCCHSQPDPIIAQLNFNSGSSSVPMPTDPAAHLFSFSQPAADSAELMKETGFVSSNRMTRFYARFQDGAECVARVTGVLEEFNYSWKVFREGRNVNVITVSTVDRRKSPLVFKATIVECPHGDRNDRMILLDFRLSRGDGLEFKRHFCRLKEALKDTQLNTEFNFTLLK